MNRSVKKENLISKDLKPFTAIQYDALCGTIRIRSKTVLLLKTENLWV